jgi:hypothetical protein
MRTTDKIAIFRCKCQYSCELCQNLYFDFIYIFMNNSILLILWVLAKRTELELCFVRYIFMVKIPVSTKIFRKNALVLPVCPMNIFLRFFITISEVTPVGEIYFLSGLKVLLKFDKVSVLSNCQLS